MAVMPSGAGATGGAADADAMGFVATGLAGVGRVVDAPGLAGATGAAPIACAGTLTVAPHLHATRLPTSSGFHRNLRPHASHANAAESVCGMFGMGPTW